MTESADYLARRLPELLEVLLDSDVRELDVQEGELRVRVRRRPVRAADAEASVQFRKEELVRSVPSTFEVVSPIVGTFYRAAKAGDLPLVTEGSRVTEDSIVGIVEALQMPTEVEAGVAGSVISILAADGQPVEFGQALVEVALDA
jgi:acetyl-CoA carboxylase biotin carboxyl carrier protein